MRRRTLAGLISSIFLLCLWVEPSSIATAKKEDKKTVIIEHKRETAKIEILHVMNAMNTSSQHDEIPILLLNLNLDNENMKNN